MHLLQLSLGGGLASCQDCTATCICSTNAGLNSVLTTLRTEIACQRSHAYALPWYILTEPSITECCTLWTTRTHRHAHMQQQCCTTLKASVNTNPVTPVNCNVANANSPPLLVCCATSKLGVLKAENCSWMSSMAATGTSTMIHCQLKDM